MLAGEEKLTRSKAVKELGADALVVGWGNTSAEFTTVIADSNFRQVTRHHVASNGEKACQMISPTGVHRIEAESAFLSPMKFSTGPTNSMYRRNGFRKR
jgi:hypothetical protein